MAHRSLQGTVEHRSVSGQVSDLQDSFAALLGRQPTDKERQDLYRVRDALGIGRNDALWLVLMALQHYESQYEKFPKAIADAAESTLKSFRITAREQARAAAESTKQQLAKAVAEASHTVARNVAKKQRLQWLLGTVLGCTLALGALGALMFTQGLSAGERRGYVEGYEAAKDEKAAASWGATTPGRRARRLARAGSLELLAACSQPGWRAKDGVCLPYTAEDGRVYGWRLR